MNKRLNKSLFCRFYHPLFKLQQKLHAQSIQNPTKFWGDAAKDISWCSPFTSVYEKQSDTWFPNGRLNMAYNCLDRHVLAGNGSITALIHHSSATETETVRNYTYKQLLDCVKILSGILRKKGLNEQSTILIYMPAIPEAMISMLSSARLGAKHVVVFGGFASPELAIRLQDCKADAILSASYGLEPGKKIDYVSLVDAAINISTHKPKFKMIYDRDYDEDKQCMLSEDWIHWQIEEAKYKAEYNLSLNPDSEHPGNAYVSVKSDHPLYALHTSGSTGTPKGILRQTGGYAVGLAWSTKNVYGIDKGDTMWSASDVGWILGHSFILYGPLIRGATTILFEGKPVGQPDSSVFYKVLVQHNVRTFFCAPTALRTIKRDDPDGMRVTKHGISDKLEAVFLAGERCDPDSLKWCKNMMQKLSGGRNIEVLDNWWSTEMGWPTTATAFGLKPQLSFNDQLRPIFPDNKIGSCGMAVPGSNLKVMVPKLDHGLEIDHVDWKEAPINSLGNVVLAPPLPPGAFRTLLNDVDSKKINDGYYKRIPGYYDSADSGLIDEDGFVSIMGRIDDVINVSGHRLSTGTMEQVVSSHQDVAECCVVGIKDNITGERPIAFIVLKSHAIKIPTIELKSQIVSKMRLEIGAFASVKASQIFIVEKLPKTRSGKILRKTIRSIVNHDERIMIPPTIEDVSVIEEIQKIFVKN